MRHLVACPMCKRQYDATGRDPGDRFHCHCGQEIEFLVEAAIVLFRMVR